MKSLRLWIFLVLMLLMAGCGLYSEEPLGVVKPLKPEEWNGLWLVGDEKKVSVVQIEVIDPERAIISGREPCKQLDARNEEGLLLMRSAERGWYFPVELEHDAQGQLKEKGPPFEYTFFFSRPSVSSWLWYAVDVDRVRTLVQKGTLPGRVEGESPPPLPPGVVEGDPMMTALRGGSYRVTLGHLEPEHYKVLLSEERALVHWQEPSIFIKLPRGFDPCKKGEQTK
jgi:hypothetical protein